MRPNPLFDGDDPALVRQLIRDHPWATIVSQSPGGALIGSHYPVLLDEDSAELALLPYQQPQLADEMEQAEPRRDA